MKIDSNFKLPAASQSSRAKSRVMEESSVSTEEVSLSSVASTGQGTEAVPVSPSKIQEIKDAIAQGRLTINPDAIAGRLLESARDLVNKRKA